MTVDMYIYEQQEPVRALLDYLHHLVLHIKADATAAIKWNVPFYSGQDAFLYLNPQKNKKGGVELCFPRGQHFLRGRELLDFKDRKVVGGYTVYSLEGINEEEVQHLIKESIAADIRLAGTSVWK